MGASRGNGRVQIDSGIAITVKQMEYCSRCDGKTLRGFEQVSHWFRYQSILWLMNGRQALGRLGVGGEFGTYCSCPGEKRGCLGPLDKAVAVREKSDYF